MRGEGTAGRQTPHLNAAGRSWLPAWREEAEDTRPARASLLLMSSREWNGVSHDACKDVKLTADAGGSVHPYSDNYRGGRYRQIA